jgi:hypothetical protein
MTIKPEDPPAYNPANADDTPRGTIILVERQNPHELFLQGCPPETKVLLRIDDVRRILSRGETADSFYNEELTVITTTTVHDRILGQLTWEEEAELIRAFKPDYHIPCDYPVYKHDDEDTRRKHVRNCLEGVLFVGHQLSDVKTQIIPLVKGETTDERELCYNLFETIGARYVAFYAAQYFLSGKGFTPLLQSLQAIASEAPHLKIMVIGLQSPRLLAQVPPQVVAAAGQRWINEVQLRDVPVEKSCELFGQMNREIESVLSSGQAPLSMWAESSGVTA